MPDEPISVVPKGFDEAFARLSSEGQDPLETGEGEDTLETGEGEDTLEAGAGEGTAEAGAGEGTAEAGAGEDTSEAGAGEDTAESGEGEDTAESGEGEDTAESGAGEGTPAGQKEQRQEGAEDPIERLARLLSQPDTQTKGQKESEGADTASEERPEIYTEEEKRVLAEYEKEWPEVARAEELRRRGEYQEVVRHIFNEVAQQLGPMAEMVQTLSERTHVQDLQEAVGDDYASLREEVVTWVEQQPAYLQGAYQRVIESGTVDEVADLINRFKAETGKGAQPKPATPPAKPTKKETELPAQTKKAAASLAPVSSKRTAVPKGEDPTDFDSAFEAFAGKT